MRRTSSLFVVQLIRLFKIMELIILAGGLGTRLRSVVKNVSKPMANVDEKPFLQYLLDFWISNGISNIIIAAGYKSETIINYFKCSYKNIPINYSIEEEPLGTGGAFIKATKLLKSNNDFLVTNGDTFFKIDLNKFKNFHKSKECLISIALFENNNTQRYKSFQLDKEFKIIKTKSIKTKKQLVNGGIYLFKKSILNNLNFLNKKGNKISLEDDIFNHFIKINSKVYGLFFDKPFIDIGLPYDYKLSKQFFLENI